MDQSNESEQSERELRRHLAELESEHRDLDDLDLPPGTVRLKQGGGHGGHNGLRDIVAHCGRDFFRLRIGIGHPGDKSRVTGYVLRPPAAPEKRLIETSLADARSGVETLLREGPQRAMHQLHTAADQG